MTMRVDKGGAEQPLQGCDPVTGIFTLDGIDYAPRFICYQYRRAGQYVIAVEKMVCGKFSVQNDWLIYCKFAA